MSNFAIVDVNVVPMDAERVLPHHTVIVSDGRITRMGPTSELEPPPGAGVIAGGERWLMPGLADMHAHYRSGDAAPLFLANGVTTVRIMWGRPDHLNERDGGAAGERVAPTIVCGSPIVDGDPPTWGGMIAISDPAAVDETLDAQVAAGYDFIKIYNLVSLPLFDAIMRWSHDRNVPVAGHLPNAVPLEHALRSGFASVEHAHASMKEALRDDSRIRGQIVNNATLIAHAQDVDESRFTDVAAMAASHGGTFCPTLVVNAKLSYMDQRDQLMGEPELKYVHPATVAGWDPAKDARFNNKGGPAEAGFEGLRQVERLGKPLVRALSDAGARLLLGSDETNPFVVAGFSIHDELRLFVEAGLSPYQALRAGTAAPGEFLRRYDTFGTISEGARADLLLLDGNPLDDVAHARTPAGVMARGRWLPRAELDAMLDGVAAKYESA